MNKLILTFALVSIIGLVVAENFDEPADVKEATKSAYHHGKSFFAKLSGKAKEEQAAEAEPPKKKEGPFSLYTAKLGRALGGGKPALVEQYNNHKFTPLTPSVVPRELPPPTKGLTAEDAALRYVPQPPYQYTTDRLRH